MIRYLSRIWSLPTILGTFLVVLSLGVSASTAGAAPVIIAQEGATSTVTLTPSVTAVSRGDTFVYTITVTNNHHNGIDKLFVTLPYNHDQIVPIGATLNQKAGDWVSSRDDTQITVTFGSIGVGQSRTGQIAFRVRDLNTNTGPIVTRAAYEWHHKKHSGQGQSSTVKVQIQLPPPPPQGAKSRA